MCKGATCNGQDTSGCGQTPATAPAGFGANGVAIDQETNQVYVTAIEDTSVRTIEGTKERVVDRRYDPFVKLMRRIAGHKQH